MYLPSTPVVAAVVDINYRTSHIHLLYLRLGGVGASVVVLHSLPCAPLQAISRHEHQTLGGGSASLVPLQATTYMSVPHIS